MRNDNDGIALVFAIWVLAILMVIVVAFAWNESTEVRIASGAIDAISARYLAEAGLTRAIGEIKVSYTNTEMAQRAWVSTDHAVGSTWARLGQWDGSDAAVAQQSGLRSTWATGGQPLKYYFPSEATSYTANDVGYFQVAVQDESGKFNLNSTINNTLYNQMVDAAALTTTSIDATDAAKIETAHAHPFRTIGEVGLATDIGLAKTYTIRSYLTVYPEAPVVGSDTYDVSGRINVNSAPTSVLAAIRQSGSASLITSAKAADIVTHRVSDPYDNWAELVDENWTPGAADIPDSNAVRFDSQGFYRIFSRGVTTNSKGDERAEAIIEAYIKATFTTSDGSDSDPVQIIYWREWFEIP